MEIIPLIFWANSTLIFFIYNNMIQEVMEKAAMIGERMKEDQDRQKSHDG